MPIKRDVTFEDETVRDPAERLKVFGQEDHVRMYGADYVDRLREAGFTVTVTRRDELVQGDETVRMGLTPETGEIYYCTKESG